MDAAAELGDVEEAATVLDLIIRKELQTDLLVFNSAINACKNADPPKPPAATYLLATLLDRGLQPSVVTFTNLAGAHKHAAHPNEVFAATYLSALMSCRLQNVRTFRAADNVLAGVSEDRLLEARRALRQFEQSRVKLASLCRRMRDYLEQKFL